jgi:hypothetical protein
MTGKLEACSNKKSINLFQCLKIESKVMPPQSVTPGPATVQGVLY